MQVDPGSSQLTPRLLLGTFRGFQLLKLEYDKLLSNLAFNCNLRLYNEVATGVRARFLVGPDKLFMPRHRMPFNSTNEGL